MPQLNERTTVYKDEYIIFILDNLIKAVEFNFMTPAEAFNELKKVRMEELDEMFKAQVIDFESGKSMQ